MASLLWGADARGEPLLEIAQTTAPSRLALLVGNEGGGLTDDGAHAIGAARLHCRSDGVDSLNVAVAAGMFLYELRQ